MSMHGDAMREPAERRASLRAPRLGQPLRTCAQLSDHLEVFEPCPVMSRRLALCRPGARQTTGALPDL